MKNVLIAGGTGLIGNRLTQYLLKKGYSVSVLTRNAKPSGTDNVVFYAWNPEEHFLPDEPLLKADYVVNLAGAGISNRWTKKYKKQIFKSRVDATTTLVSAMNKYDHKIRAFISGSAIGYYGYNRAEELNENSKNGVGFLAEVCYQWESEAAKLNCKNTRLIISRTGIVLSPEGGALPQMALPVKYFIGSPMGSGKQYVSWIHIDDLCRLYVHLLEHQTAAGVFNIVSRDPVTNAELTKTIARILHKPLWLPNIPGFILRMLLGEMTDSLLGSLKVNPEMAINTGFEFSYSNLSEAIEDILSGKGV